MPPASPPAYDRNNIFARILRGEAPCTKVYEDDYALAFKDIYPKARVHVLAIPKGEYVSLTDFSQSAPPELIAGFWRAVARIAEQLGVADGYRIGSNIGPGGGQVVFRFHVHIMSGRRGLLAGAALLFAAPAAAQQYYRSGTKQRSLRFRGSGDVTLSGTLLLPTISELQKVPGVVLVAGSGPTDRDGNNPLVPARIDLLKQIAELLANSGIATLRYDKRGIGASTAQPANRLDEQERFWAWDNFVADVMAAHAELLRHDEIKSYATAFVGHSEGGLLSLAAAAAMGKRAPYALVLASTPALPLIDIVRAQIARDMPQRSAEVERIMKAALETGHMPLDVPEELRLVFPAYAGAYFRGALTFNPVQALSSLDAACLLLHGGADAQVRPMAEIQPLIDALGRRGKPGEVLVVPAVSHSLKAASGPSDAGFAGPIAPAIADKLAGWLRHVLGA